MGEKKKEVEVNQDRTDELIRTGKEALDKAGRSHTSGTVYDDIFRLLLEKYPRLILPLLSELFGEQFDGDEELVLLQNELMEEDDKGVIDKIISDVNFVVKDKNGRVRHYHLECQSTKDKTMVVRMFRYDSRIAIRDSKLEDGVLVVRFPDSAVLCLRSTDSTPDHFKVRIVVRGNKSVEYEIPTMKMANYNSETIFERNLYFLLPFLPFNDEKRYKACNEDNAKLGQLLMEYQGVVFELEENINDGKVEGQAIKDLTVLFEQVVDQLAMNYGKVRKGVAEIMNNGKFWLESDRVREEGREEGRKEGVVDALAILLKTGMPEHTALEMIAEQKGTTVKEIEEVVYEGKNLVRV